MTAFSKAAATAAVVSLFAFSAGAASLSFADCDEFGCKGSSISLSVEETATDVYKVTLTLDSTDYNGPRDGVNQAGFKAFGGDFDVSLLSAPTAGWSDPILSPITSNGTNCGSSSTAGHVCTTGFTDITSGGEYVWMFEVEGGTLLPTTDWHIGFQYANSAEPTRGQIISAQAPVPEPSAALVFSAGLGVVGLRLHSLRRQPRRS